VNRFLSVCRTVARRCWRWGILALVVGAGSDLPAGAQAAQQWTTNYYQISGATLPEIRQSIREFRPWKSGQDVDGLTDWRVSWQFSVTPTPGGCRCSTFTTQTRVVITLPRWMPPTNAPGAVVQIWTNYFAALLRHEVGHGQLAVAAAEELHRRVKALGGGIDCDSLKRTLNGLGETVTAEYRQRDKEYDERTRHGASQGAALPRRSRRERVNPE
jgi:predicted secreted Zn-dependent protease